MENNMVDEKKAMLHDALILFAITLISGILLGFVYQLTLKPIAVQEQKAIDKSCKAVFESATSFEEKEYVPSSQVTDYLQEQKVSIGKVYSALDGSGSSLGYVLEVTTSKGYGGNITIYMGVTNDGTLNGISILKSSETPGLGLTAKDVLVPQFKDKKVESFSYTKSGSTKPEEIDAITGATITTKAITGAVNSGLFAAQTDLINGQEGAINE